MYAKLANGQRATQVDIVNLAHMLLAITFIESPSQESILAMAQEVGLSRSSSELYLQTLIVEKYVLCEDGQIQLADKATQLVEEELNKMLAHRAEMN